MHPQLKPCTLHTKLTHLYNDVSVNFSIQQHFLFNLTKNRLFYFANTSHYNKDSEKQLVKDVSLKEHGLENLLSQEIMSESRVAKHCLTFKINVLAYDPYKPISFSSIDIQDVYDSKKPI